MRFVGIGELASSNCAQDTLVTLGLGSCVAIAVSHVPSQSAALAHVALPSSRWDNHRRSERPPAFYADLAVDRIFHELGNFPGFTTSSSQVTLIGGASLGARSTMQVGAKNIGAIMQALSSYRVLPGHSLTGGTTSRNVRLEVSDGRIWVKEPNHPEREL